MIIDKTKPAPEFDVCKHDDGWSVESMNYVYAYGFATEDEAIAESHRLYAALCAPAVLDFAERVMTWMFECPEGRLLTHAQVEFYASDHAADLSWPKFTSEQILAAARGERSMP